MTSLRSGSPEVPVAVAAAAAAAVVAVYLLRLDSIVGLMIDDGWYVLLGKSLAEGTGYGFVNSPTPGGLTPYPPGFPAILAALFSLGAGFPRDIWLLKSVSIVAAMGVGIASHRYFITRHVPARLALLMAAATVLTPGLVFLATSTVMSECLFTLTQLLTVLVVDRAANGSRRRRDTIVAALLASATMLLRSAGAALVGGTVLYLFYRRRWRDAAIFIAVVLACQAPWMWYAQAHATTPAQRLEQGSGYAFSYGENFWMRWAGHPTAGFVTVSDLPARVKDNLVDVFGRDLGAIVFPSLFRGPAESGEEVVALGGGIVPASMGSARGTIVVSLLLSALIVLGFWCAARNELTVAEVVLPLAIVMIVLWPFWAYRFVLPLTPFVFLYLAIGIRKAIPSPAAVRIVMLSVVGLQVLDHTQYILLRRTQVVDWAADARDTQALIDWMKRTLDSDGYVATTNPPLVYLHTGRRTVALEDPDANWQRWKRDGVRYLVCLRPRALPAASIPYRVLYRSPDRGFWVIEI